MAYQRSHPRPPVRGEALELRASPGGGVWWERKDGLEVRLAAPERERAVERARLSLLGMLVACLAADGNGARRA
jgi:hypothetical protein